jgi:hypothetical protein
MFFFASLNYRSLRSIIFVFFIPPRTQRIKNKAFLFLVDWCFQRFGFLFGFFPTFFVCLCFVFGLLLLELAPSRSTDTMDQPSDHKLEFVPQNKAQYASVASNNSSNTVPNAAGVSSGTESGSTGGGGVVADPSAVNVQMVTTPMMGNPGLSMLAPSPHASSVVVATQQQKQQPQHQQPQHPQQQQNVPYVQVASPIAASSTVVAASASGWGVLNPRNSIITISSAEYTNPVASGQALASVPRHKTEAALTVQLQESKQAVVGRVNGHFQSQHERLSLEQTLLNMTLPGEILTDQITFVRSAATSAAMAGWMDFHALLKIFYAFHRYLLIYGL